MPKKKKGRQLRIHVRVKLQLALQDRRISMRLSGMKLPMLLMCLVLLMRLSGMKLPMLLTPLVLLNPSLWFRSFKCVCDWSTACFAYGVYVFSWFTLSIRRVTLTNVRIRLSITTLIIESGSKAIMQISALRTLSFSPLSLEKSCIVFMQC